MHPHDTPRPYATRRPPVALACPECQRPFVLQASRLSAARNHFCSGPCRDAYTARQRRVDPVIRFWANVAKDSPLPEIHPEYGSCWPRRGANCQGYGVFNDGIIKAAKATHFAWSLSSGQPLPFGAVIGHVCDNPPCVRNDDVGTYAVDGVLYERRGHLWLAGGSPANSRDMKVKERASRTGNPMFKVVGQDRFNAKLTDDDVRAIRSLCAGGMYQADVANRFGLGQSSVSRIVLRKAWAHVE